MPTTFEPPPIDFKNLEKIDKTFYSNKQVSLER